MKSIAKWIVVLAAAVALVALGRCTADRTAGHTAEPASEGARTDAGAQIVWSCPMHPQVRLPEFGPCPICGMDLVLLDGAEDAHPRRIELSEAARALAHVETAPVVRRAVTRPVRMVGKLALDQTAVRTISAWVPGRLERLYVDYEGVRVAQGEHLVRLYSPDLLTAQQELLSARERLEATAAEKSEFLADSSRGAYEAAREKLLLWGLTEAQVEAIVERGSAEDHVLLTSPASGVVVDKLLDEGAYVQTGTHIYRIADLGRLWVLLDAYEQDLAWLRHGQEIVIEAEALPGERFEGRIAFIDPVVHERTRTAKVRVNLDNESGRLKPGMFVRAVARARLGAGGAVLEDWLAGKWVSPMHPEIVKEGPGQCDVCGMDLVRAEELGLVSRAPEGERALVVPASAVLLTGRRAVVYVEVPDAERPTYEGREIVVGPRAGDWYLVLEGLAEGERVVVNGAFRLDSAMQIRAQPSMMSVEGEAGALRGPLASFVRASLRPLYDAYGDAHAALARDDAAAARDALARLAAAVEAVAAEALPAAYRERWSEARRMLDVALANAREADDLATLRAAFEPTSRAVLALERSFGHDADEVRREVHCPTAFDGAGASWLQTDGPVANPYLGASMLRCGEARERFAPAPAARAADERAGAPAADPRESGHEAGQHEAGQHEADVDEADVDEGADERALAPVFERYLELGRALAADDDAAAREALLALNEAAQRAAPESAVARAALEGIESSGGIDARRRTFERISDALIARAEERGNPLDVPLRVVHCPMAFGNAGADWLQSEPAVANPYFGASMLRCGTVRRVLAPRVGPREEPR